ncbi:unnamed protein product, partial [Linum tenue]
EHELDLTSKLPDDVVIHLLSFLNLKEAIRTSVLSGRWRDLWKSANLALDFEAEKELLDIYNGGILLDDTAMAEYRMWYKNAVNGVIKTPDGLSDVKSLRSLRLNCVAVRAEILEHFISSCPLLEELAVARVSNSLKKLRVVGSSQSPLRLKYLELRYFNYLKSLEIDHTPCLVRLIYDACPRMEELRVGNCPGLVDLTLGLHTRYNFAFEAFSGCASQLKSLLLKTKSVVSS